MEKGKGLRFGYYSNSLNFLDLLSFQTTLVIDAKINKMCCPTKENTCFFLIGQTFLLSFQWFNYLAEILLIFGRNKLCPLFVDFIIGITYSYLWYGRRKEAGISLSKSFGKSASCHISVYRPYFLRYGFQQDNFSDFFRCFSFSWRR